MLRYITYYAVHVECNEYCGQVYHLITLPNFFCGGRSTLANFQDTTLYLLPTLILMLYIISLGIFILCNCNFLSLNERSSCNLTYQSPFKSVLVLAAAFMLETFINILCSLIIYLYFRALKDRVELHSGRYL